jgi:hypothetical protein
MSKNSMDNGGISGPYLMDKKTLTAAANVALAGADGSIFQLTPGEDETLTASGFENGERVFLVVLTSGTTSRTLTFGTGFKSTGTLATGTTSGKYFVLSFVVVNDLLIETSRTTAQ